MRLTPDQIVTQGEILNRLNLYCRGVDRKDWKTVRACFHTDAIDNHGGTSRTVDGFLDWLVARHATVSQSFHAVLSVSYAHLGPSRVHTEAYAIALQTDDKQPGLRRSVGCRYLDIFELFSDEWRIVHREVLYEWVDLVSVAADLLDRAGPGCSRRDASDPSYTHLSRS